MDRKAFIKQLLIAGTMGTLSSFKRFTDELPKQNKRMPVLFTSHGNPMDIPLSRDERKFWMTLYNLGTDLKKNYDVKAALVISAHWCTKGTFVNISPKQEQIFDYYGFPKEYYEVVYKANGAPEIAHEVKNIIPSINETTEWGLDHGAWPLLMHLFPKADVPVFELSLSYYETPEYHYNLAKQLISLRQKGVLIIGSGALIHNLKLAGQKMRNNDMKPYGWEAEYDFWLKQKLTERNIKDIINYETSNTLGKLAAPTPDHFVPVLYSLGLMHKDDRLDFFYEPIGETLPAFSERSFILS